MKYPEVKHMFRKLGASFENTREQLRQLKPSMLMSQINIPKMVPHISNVIIKESYVELHTYFCYLKIPRGKYHDNCGLLL